MRTISVLLISFVFLIACDQVRFYSADAIARTNFQTNKDGFIAFGEALDAHPQVIGATNCSKEDCWRIGRNFPHFGDQIDPEINDMFVPHLESIGLSGYVFFQRGADGRVWLPDYAGGWAGDFSLTLSYVYWPKPDSTFISCKNYTPPTDDFYDCSLELEHGWMLQRSGVNQVKLEACAEQITDCQMNDDDGQASCIPAECSELWLDW